MGRLIVVVWMWCAVYAIIHMNKTEMYTEKPKELISRC